MKQQLRLGHILMTLITLGSLKVFKAVNVGDDCGFGCHISTRTYTTKNHFGFRNGINPNMEEELSKALAEENRRLGRPPMAFIPMPDYPRNERLLHDLAESGVWNKFAKYRVVLSGLDEFRDTTPDMIYADPTAISFVIYELMMDRHGTGLGGGLGIFVEDNGRKVEVARQGQRYEGNNLPEALGLAFLNESIAAEAHAKQHWARIHELAQKMEGKRK